MKYEYGSLIKKNAIMGKRYSVDGEHRYIAYNHESWADNTPLFQYTKCKKCNTKLMSWAKDAQCPKCNTKCYLT